MAEFTDDQLWNMSDEDLEAAFAEAKMNGVTVGEQAPEEVFEDEIDMEQPEQDSVNEEEIEISSNESESEEATDDSETVDATHDGEAEAEEEQPEEAAEEEVEEEQEAQDDIITVRADGQDYHFTTAEMREKFGTIFGQAMNYTKKMQQMKPHRQMLDAITNAKLSNADVNLMIDAFNGSKEALATIMKRTGIDALDLDSEAISNYVPKEYGRNETELDIKEIVDEIAGDREYVTTHDIIERRWDDKSRMEFVKDPRLIKALHIDVKSGMYNTIEPIATKLKMYETGPRKSDFEYYMLAAKQYNDNKTAYEAQVAERARVAQEKQAAESKRIQDVKEKQAKLDADKLAASKRKAAVPTKKASVPSRSIDYLDDSDEAFEQWYAENVTNKQ
jgi:hypothetical protein